MLGIEQIFYRLVTAVILSGLFGLEREYHRKKAGMRTNMMVGLGSALAMIMSVNFDTDPARIAAGVLTGIGFLGAGVIIQSQGEVYGVTTAATIWVVAAIGLACGMGYYTAAVATTLVGLVVLYLFGFPKVREKLKLND